MSTPKPRPPFAPVYTDEQRATLREKRGLSDFQIDSLAERGLRFRTIDVARLEGRTGASAIAKALSHSTTKKVTNAPPAIAIPWFDHQTLNVAKLPRLSKREKPTDERVSMVRLRWDEEFSLDDRPGKKPGKYGQAGQIPFIVYVPTWGDARTARADASKPLVIAEGEFKALALAQEGYAVIGIGGCNSAHDKPFKEALGVYRLHRWITGGAFYGEHRAPLCPLAGRRVLLALDGDSREKPDVDRALTQIAGMLALEGVDDIRNACPPDVPGLGKVGIDDYLAHRGPEALHAFLNGNLPRVEPQIDPRAQQLAEKREIVLSRLSLHDDVTATLDALAEDPRIFRYGDGLVDLVPGEGDMERLTKPSLVAERIERRCFFMGENGPVSTPARLADNLVSRTTGFGPIRPLTMVSRDPVLRADGSVHTSGYDSELRVFVEPRVDAEELGDLDDVAGAREALLEVVREFDFRDATEHGHGSRAGWFAALFACVARHLIDGPCPMALFEATDQESGKTLLIRLIHRIAFDIEPPDGTAPKSAEELEKRLFASVLQGRRTFVMDNAQNRSTIGAACLDQYLTSTIVTGRILGKTEMANAPMRMVLFASGNNVRLRGDINRRVTLTRIEKWTGPFQRPDIEQWAKRNRTRLLAATMTLIRAWLRAGRPAHPWARWGGFSEWDVFVRGVLAFHDLGDPKDMRVLVDAMHDENVPLEDLLTALEPLGPVTAKSILAQMGPNPELQSAVEGLFDERERMRELTPRTLTRRLTRYVNQAAKGSKLVTFPMNHTLHFQVRPVRASGIPGFADQPHARRPESSYMYDQPDRDPKGAAAKPGSPEARPAADVPPEFLDELDALGDRLVTGLEGVDDAA